MNRPQMTNSMRSEPVEPKKVRSGVRLQGDEPGLLVDRRSGSWIQLLRQLASEAEVERGREYAVAGQTVVLDFEPSRIVADVQDLRRRPHRVTIVPEPWIEAQWKQLIEVLAAHPAHASAILVNELSEATFNLLAREGLRLVPHDPSSIEIMTDAPDDRRGSIIACVLYLVAERVLQSPMELFLLRGLRVETLLERIRQHRLIESLGVAAAHPVMQPSFTMEPTPALEESLDQFWTASPVDRRDSGGRHVSHALLRRMGPSPIPGRFPIVGLLASVYDEVSAELSAAAESAEASEVDDDDAGDSNDTDALA